MFCPKCGATIPDGSSKCEKCGNDIGTRIRKEEKKTFEIIMEEIIVHSEEVVDDLKGIDDGCESTTEITAESKPFAPWNLLINSTNLSKPENPLKVSEELEKEEATSELTKEKKPNVKKPRKEKRLKKNVKVVIVAAASLATVILLACGLFFGRNLFQRKNESAYIFYSDGKYSLIKNLEKDKVVNFGTSAMINDQNISLRFSPDGKYVYYYSNVDTSKSFGTLHRADYSKLNDNASRNEKYDIVIDDDVSQYYLYFLDGEEIAYKKSDDSMFYFNGKELSKIGDEINQFLYDKEKKRVIYTAYNKAEGVNSLYGADLADLSNAHLIEEDLGYESISSYVNSDLFFYNMLDPVTETYYKMIAGFDKEPELFFEAGNIISIEDEVVYYVEEKTPVNLYDYVQDDLLESDQTITEPRLEDYEIPVYTYNPLRGGELNEEDYSELYTSCNMPLTWCRGKSMNDYIKSSGEQSQTIDALKGFVEKYQNISNEDGYILVTSEIKRELQKINSTGSEGFSWLWLCCTHEATETDYDWDKYEEEQAQYEQAKARNELRESLKSYTGVNLYDLCTYQNGKKSVIVNDVYSCRIVDGGILYRSKERLKPSFNISEVTMRNVSGYFSCSTRFDDSDMLLSTKTNKKYELPENIHDIFVKVNSREIYDYYYPYFILEDKKLTFLADIGVQDSDLSIIGKGAYSYVYEAQIKNGKIGNLELKIGEFGQYWTGGEKVYYTKDFHKSDNNSKVYCSIYKNEDGKEISVTKNIQVKGCTYYEDGVVLGYTGNSLEGNGSSLTIYDSDGKSNKIADGVTQYVRTTEGDVLYIADNDLFVYDGEGSRLVCSHVTNIWSFGSIDGNEMQVEDYVIEYYSIN